MRRAIVVASVLVVAGPLAWARGGTAPSGPDLDALDASFGGDGKVISRLRPRGSWAQAVALQSDGRLVVAGGAFDANPKFAIARYDADGSLDTTFGGDGKVTTDIGPREDYAGAVAVQADGKILAVGRGSGSGPQLALARYDVDGSLDETFAQDGTVVTPAVGTAYKYGVALQPDGRIVAAGGGVLARFMPDGALDPTFGGDGTVAGSANGVAIQADGKIVAAAGFAVARYNPDGGLDTSFSDDGMAPTFGFSTGAWVSSVAVQTDGRIVAVGGGQNCFGGGTGCDLYFAIFRYEIDGSADTTFGSNGLTSGSIGEAFGVAIQPDGKIVAAGVSGVGHFALTRHDSEGVLDETFGGDGRILTRLAPRYSGAYALALQADGKVVAAGFAQRARFPKFALARYAAP